MEMRIGVLADAANESDGKLNLLGVFLNILTEKFPCVHPSMFLVAQFHYGMAEAGPTEMTVELVDPDGRELSRISGELTLGVPAAGSPGLFNLKLALNGQVFPIPGSYEFHLRIGQATEAIIPFQVLAIPR